MNGKQRYFHKHPYIGKNVDGEFIPNRSYRLEQKLKEKQEQAKPGPVPVQVCQRKFFRAPHLPQTIADPIGITADLTAKFPGTCQEL